MRAFCDKESDEAQVPTLPRETTKMGALQMSYTDCGDISGGMLVCTSRGFDRSTSGSIILVSIEVKLDHHIYVSEG